MNPFLFPPDSVSRRIPAFILAGLLLSTMGMACVLDGYAQETKNNKPYALIFGTVWGPDNHPLYGVKVRVRRADDKKPRWELYSDHHGEFALRLPPGPADYLVWADLKGYKSPSGNQLDAGGEVKVHIENDERADIGLHLK